MNHYSLEQLARQRQNQLVEEGLREARVRQAQHESGQHHYPSRLIRIVGAGLATIIKYQSDSHHVGFLINTYIVFVKETYMFTKRFLLVIGTLSLLLVSPLTNDPVDTSWPPRPDYSHLNEKPIGSIPVDMAEAYRLYRQSERTLIDPNAGLAIYQQSEWFGK